MSHCPSDVRSHRDNTGLETIPRGLDLTCQQGTRNATLWPTKLIAMEASLPPRSPVETAGAAATARLPHRYPPWAEHGHRSIILPSTKQACFYTTCTSPSVTGRARSGMELPPDVSRCHGETDRVRAHFVSLSNQAVLSLVAKTQAWKTTSCFHSFISHSCFEHITQHKCVARSIVSISAVSLLSYTSGTHLATSFRAGAVHQR